MILDYLFNYKRKFEALQGEYRALSDRLEGLRESHNQIVEMFKIREKGLMSNIEILEKSNSRLRERLRQLDPTPPAGGKQ